MQSDPEAGRHLFRDRPPAGRPRELRVDNCGRFQASTSPAELARWFKTTGPLPNVQQRYNAAPTQDLPHAA